MTSHLTMDFERFNPDAQDPGTKRVYKLNVASLPGGEMLRLAVLVAKGAEPGPTLVAFGGVHGDEYEGPHAAKTVYRGLDPAQLSGTFIAVPQCNVPAFATGTRTSPIDGLNLARIFPGNADGTVTERIAWNLAEHVIARANFLIDLHSSGAGSDIATLIGYYMSDDEMGQKSLAAARGLWDAGYVGPPRTLAPAVASPTATPGEFPGFIPNPAEADGWTNPTQGYMQEVSQTSSNSSESSTAKSTTNRRSATSSETATTTPPPCPCKRAVTSSRRWMFSTASRKAIP